MKNKSVLLLLLFAATTIQAAEYFVAPEGDDGRDGRSRELAFRTVQKGVDALNTGDTLTILPGEYFENVQRANLGGPEAETVIRAAIPGTVLLRGDVPMPALEPVPGSPSVFVAEFTRPVQTVNERDTLTMLVKAASPDDLAFLPGCFYHDQEAGRLYMSASHLKRPDPRAYTVSVLGTHGLYLERPQRVVLDGLAATGFNTAEMLPAYPGYRGAWGIIVARGLNCVIRNCTAFLNGGGIALYTAGANRRQEPGTGNVIEHCVAWANTSRFISEGANIAGFGVNNDTIRNCETYSGGRGIRIYGGIGPGRLESSLARDGDMQIKGGVLHSFDGPGLVDRCVSPGAVHAHNLSHTLVGTSNAYRHGVGNPPDSILLAQEKELEQNHEFADPENFDFRLQADSRFIGTGPEGTDRGPFPYRPDGIFYVHPEGSDTADGLSMKRGWRTPAHATSRLQPGQTLYLAPGRYSGNLEIVTAEGAPVVLRGRGLGTVEVDGEVRVRGPGSIIFERLNFLQPVTVNGGSAVAFRHCVFAATDKALSMTGVSGVRLEHCRFPARGPEFAGCSGIHLAGNLFAGETQPALAIDDPAAVVYADYNLYGAAQSLWRIGAQETAVTALPPAHERYSQVGAGLDVPVAGPFGRGAGPYRPLGEQPLNVTAPVLHAVTDTTADFEWRTSQPLECQVTWRRVGDTKKRPNRERWPLLVHGFTSYSLWGLEPDTEYELQVTVKEAFLLDGQAAEQKPFTIAFRTAAAPRAPVSWFVATDGNDAADGHSREQSLRTVGAAAARAGAGDTVWVAGGTYSEVVYVRSTGTEAQPLTFRSLPGEKVVFDGKARALPHAFMLTGKAHVHLDGFYFTGFGFGGRRRSDQYHSVTSGIVNLCITESVRITRCFSDGRGLGYAPPLVGATYSPRLLVQNCVIAFGSNGLNLRVCHHARLENNVIMRNMIQQYIIVGWARMHEFHTVRNIIIDNPSNKTKSLLLEVPNIQFMQEQENCYFLRVSDEDRKMFLASGARLSLADYQAKYGDKGSFIADPQFQGMVGKAAVDYAGRPAFPPDLLYQNKDLDFPDLFATNPRLVERGIGLQPQAFADFHFAVKNPEPEPAPAEVAE